jgi:hypothetical protein
MPVYVMWFGTPVTLTYARKPKVPARFGPTHRSRSPPDGWSPSRPAGRFAIASVKAAVAVAGGRVDLLAAGPGLMPQGQVDRAVGVQSRPDRSTLNPLSSFSSLPGLPLADLSFHLGPGLVGQNAGPATPEGAAWPITALSPLAPAAGLSAHGAPHDAGYNVRAEVFQTEQHHLQTLPAPFSRPGTPARVRPSSGSAQELKPFGPGCPPTPGEQRSFGSRPSEYADIQVTFSVNGQWDVGLGGGGDGQS